MMVRGDRDGGVKEMLTALLPKAEERRAWHEWCWGSGISVIASIFRKRQENSLNNSLEKFSGGGGGVADRQWGREKT
ncbi:hypothetical protein Tco_0162532 [Tanacetum coccineum]|uniref:Uncharacterized protein n=1 Tax=Tanacetum coccineum TaxID=301880 RepID=A0ABQ5BBF7_9ASTR